jgi:hypothetical protein
VRFFTCNILGDVNRTLRQAALKDILHRNGIATENLLIVLDLSILSGL